MTTKRIQTITTRKASVKFDHSLFEGITWSKTLPSSHTKVASSLKKFDQLCVPRNDIGANYPACTNEQINNLKHGNLFMQWDPWHAQRIEIIQYD